MPVIYLFVIFTGWLSSYDGPSIKEVEHKRVEQIKEERTER